MFKAQAVILAGGQGSRLRPYTSVLPKPLLPVEGVPILEIIIRQLRRHGFRRIVISTGYLSNLIRTFCGTGEQWQTKIRYVHESKPLGTAGALTLIGPSEKNILVLNGDILTDLDFSAFVRWHVQRRAAATLAICQRTIQSDFGEVQVSSQHELVAYHEKPRHHSFVSIGVNVFDAKVLHRIQKGERLGMPELMLRLKGLNHKVCCYPLKGSWLDLGRFEDLDQAQDLFRRHKKKFMR